MPPDQFWTSQDGQILSIKNRDDRTVALTLAFWPRHPEEFEFMRPQLDSLRFSERSSLARVGLEMLLKGSPGIDGGRVLLDAAGFLSDDSFPNAAYWKRLLRPGVPVGRLFFAPAAAKLTSADIWAAIKTNALKLPNTISIDRFGRVFLTPHQSVTPSVPRCPGSTLSGSSMATPAGRSSTSSRCATRPRRSPFPRMREC